MQNRIMPKLVISQSDYEAVSRYLEKQAVGLTRSSLENEIDRAEIVERNNLPPHVVAINSHVRFLDKTNGKVREVIIAIPEQADFKRGLVSVLAPVGAALLGLDAGQEISWNMPNGDIRIFQVLSVKNPPVRTGPEKIAA